MKRILLLAVLALLWTASPASAERLYGTTDQSPPHIVSFDSASPGTFRTDQTITGLGMGETILGLDARPHAGAALYALTYGGSGVGKLYTIDPDTGIATYRATLAADPADSSAPYQMITNVATGIDFDPVSDRLQILNADRASLDVNPANGLVITDDDIPAESVLAADAHDNNLPGATSSDLFAYDSASDRLVTFDPFGASIDEVGPSGILTDDSFGSDLDIAPSGNAYATQDVVMQPGFYGVNLHTGAHTLLGTLPVALSGLTASMSNRISVTQTAQTVIEGTPSVSVTISRQDPHGATALTWTTGGGTATPGQDYTTSAGAILLADGDTTATATIPLLDDSADEPDETFDVTFALRANNEGTLLAPKQTVTILDNDGPVIPPADSDHDGIPDNSDNCPTVANPDQADGNNNDVGAACDPGDPATLIEANSVKGRCANKQSGTSDDDALVGTSFGDQIKGLAGDDALFGGAGDDCLGGDSGDDWVSGGAGNDKLLGGAGNDTLLGGAGDDTIDGGSGVNLIKAGPGDDVIKAKNKKKDTIDCGTGDDTVTADKNDKLKGCETKKF